MLYIRQKINNQNFIVADTDDNIEEICSFDKLKHYVVDLGLEITGAMLQSDGTFTVNCYNNLTDAKALKLKVFYGVSLMVNSIMALGKRLKMMYNL